MGKGVNLAEQIQSESVNSIADYRTSSKYHALLFKKTNS